MIETKTSQKTTILVVVIAILASSAFVLGRLAWSHGDASAFVSVGRELRAPGPPPDGIVVSRDIGFDGQFYFRLGLDPFTTQRTEYGLRFDDPARRQGRILYPLIAWVLSGGGKPRVLLWSLIIINIVSMGLIGLVGALLARHSGRSPFAGLFFAGVPAALISLAFDTGECVALALLLGAVFLLRRKRFGSATLVLTLAALARETTLLLAVGLLVAWILTKRQGSRNHPPAYAWLVPLGAYAGWAAFLWARWGALPSASHEGSTFGAPIIGIVRAISIWRSRGGDFLQTQFILLLATLAVLLVGLLALRRSRAGFHEKAAFVASSILVVLTQKAIWFHYVSFLRAAAEMYVFGLLLVLDSDTSLTPVASGWIPVWSFLAAKTRTVG